MIQITKKPLAFCKEDAAEHRKDAKAGGGWADNSPMCPCCEWRDGYQSGLEDGRMESGKPRSGPKKSGARKHWRKVA